MFSHVCMVHGMYAIVYQFWKGKEFRSVTIDLYCLAPSLSKRQCRLLHAGETMHPPGVCTVHSNTAIARFPVLANGWALMHCSMGFNALLHGAWGCVLWNTLQNAAISVWLPRGNADTARTRHQHGKGQWVGGWVSWWSEVHMQARRTQNILTHQILMSEIRV